MEPELMVALARSWTTKIRTFVMVCCDGGCRFAWSHSGTISPDHCPKCLCQAITVLALDAEGLMQAIRDANPGNDA